MTNPVHRWVRTQIDDDDPPTDFDWTGFDGRDPIGRIRKEVAGPTKRAGWFPNTHCGRPPSPNVGYCKTAREAALKVEAFWELSQSVMQPRARIVPGYENMDELK